MTIADLILLAQSRLATLNNARTTAAARGDTGRLAELDVEIAETETTLIKLRSAEG